MDDSDLLIQAGFSTAKMEAETRKVIAKYEEAAKRSAKKFDEAMAKVSNNETLKATAREIDRLSRKYDPAYAGAKKYERGVKELNRAVEIGAITNKEYEQGLERLVQDLERGGKGAGKFGAAMRQGSGASRSYGGALQNVGFQIGDFATQVGAGTSATQALGQQLPQLLGAFGAFGAGAGAAAAILIPLGAALYKNLTGAVDLEEQMKALSEATDAYVSVAEAAATPIETLREKYGDLADEMASVNGQLATMLGAVAELQLDQSFSSFANQFGGFSETVDRRGRNAGPGGVSESEFQRTVSSVTRAYDVARDDAEAIVRALKNVNEAVGAEQRLDALHEMLAIFTRAAESSEQLVDVFSGDIARIQQLIESTSKQVEASLTEEERRREQIFAKYAERERELAQLIYDRGIAEQELRQATLDGDLDHIKASRAVIAGIDEEIERLTDAQGRVTDLTAETEILIGALERVTFDPDNEVYQQALKLAAAVADAEQNVGDLDDADLSSLEARLNFLKDGFESLRSLAQGLDGDLSLAAQNAAAEYGRSRIQGETMRRNAVSGSAIETIKQFEGMRVSYEDANRDLLRRVGEFQDGIIGQIGRDRFNGFTEAQQASLTSIAYNYGSLPDRILPAVRGGTDQDIATAIARLQGDNDGVNRNRRLQEASAFGNTALVQSEIQQQSERQRLLEQEAKERERLQDIRTSYADLMRTQITDAEFENSLIGKSAEEQARLRAEYLLTQGAKRRGIDLNEKIAGSEETYGEAIKRTAAALAELDVVQQELQSRQEEAEASTRRMEQAQNSLKQGLIDAIVEGKNFSDVLGNVAKMLAKAALEAALFGKNGLFSGLGGGGGGLLGGLFDALFPSANGNVFSGGHHVTAYANGGVVGGPTYFPMKGGQMGLMGEAGPEAIMPLTRLPNGKLGVASSGQSGVSVTFSPVIDARGADAEAVARLESAMQRAQAEFKPRVIETMREAGKRNIQV